MEKVEYFFGRTDLLDKYVAAVVDAAAAPTHQNVVARMEAYQALVGESLEEDTLDDLDLLEALRRGGVDNWTWYGDAQKQADDWRRERLGAADDEDDEEE